MLNVGTDSKQYNKTLKIYREVFPNLSDCSAVGAVALGEHLYVCGGFDGISSLDTVEKYDPSTKIWTLVASMTKNRSAAGEFIYFWCKKIALLFIFLFLWKH